MQAQCVIKKSEIVEDNDLLRNIAAKRFENIAKNFAEQIRSNKNPDLKNKLALSDDLFLMDIIVKTISDNSISELTADKKRLNNRVRSKIKFFENIKNNGGLFNSAEVAKLLGVSKVTIKKKKDNNKLLALNLDGEFVYPVFQFSSDENNSEKGVLKGMVEILSSIATFSDVMKYGFFVQKRNVLNRYLPNEYTVVEMLRAGISDDDLKSVLRISKTFGTQDPA
jgi:hypothetical protein